ncbi:MAG TPA: hypothetical protein VLE94_07715, partial [Burkholderiaceae bacterium]|nr:hypothetical protein [Burkholderiaceae bacterium]
MNARRIILVAPLVLAASVGAHALGIVRAPSSVALGAPLNFPIRVSVASDESLNSTCVTAEAYQGDQRIAPSSLRLSIEQGNIADERVVRVYSTVAIEEPVITVTLMLGCAIRLERRFTVFADPPLVTTVAQADTSEPPRAERPAAPAPRDTAASAPRAETAAPTDSVVGTGTATRSERPPARPPRPTAAAAPARSASAPPSGARRPVRTAASPAAATAPSPAAAASARASTAPSRPHVASGPRLQL